MKRPGEDSSPAGRERLPAGDPVGRASPAARLMARRRRRGVIEKRRRDRINSCLSELRRLVPTAWEKQGAEKLEKAEILQMTVEHLRTLQAGGTGNHGDAETAAAGGGTGNHGDAETAAAGGGTGQQEVLALDFLSLGFRECVSEASCYLSAVEPRDSCDALRRRLLAHLSYCAAQRDAAAMTARLQPRPPPYSHWVAALRPDGAPQRPVELLQHSATSSSPSSSLLPPPLPAPLFSFSASFPIALPFLPSSSSSQPPHRPWSSEVGAL